MKHKHSSPLFTLMLLVTVCLTLSKSLHAQAGFPKDSIMRVVKACPDCKNMTWSKDSLHLSYEVTGQIVHRFTFNKSRICTKYEEQYPSKAYIAYLTEYMDATYIKLDSCHWRETLRTVTGLPVLDYTVYWSLTVLPNKKLLVVGEFRKIGT